jgi:hypothetical protein
MNIVLFRNDYAQDVVASFCLNTLRARPDTDVWQFCPFDLSAISLGPDHPLHTPEVAYHQIKDRADFLQQIAAKKFDLIIQMPDTNWRRGKLASWARWIFDSPPNPLSKRLRGMRWRLRMIPESLLTAIPTIVVDMHDSATLEAKDTPLLTGDRLYFKREIPYDRYRLFPGTGKPSEADLERVEANLRQIPLGVDDARYDFLRAQRQPLQDLDIFWAGGPTSSLRIEAAKRLRDIAARRGWKVSSPEGKISFTEFSTLMARSKITLSVAGRGWDCYRHSEAVAAGSVPLMNRPTVEAPAWEDLPAELFFENNFADFEEKMAALLALSSERRAQIVALCDERVRTKTRWSSIMDFILAEIRKRHPNLPA